MKISDPCPECGRPIIKGDGLRGPDLRCPDYPSCSFRIYIDEQTQKANDLNPHDTIFYDALEKTRKKLLDLTRRNALLAFKESQRTIRIMDELPDITFDYLVNKNHEMELLPSLETDDLFNERNKKGILNRDISENEKDDYELPVVKKYIEDRHQDKFLQTPFTAKPLESRAKRLNQLYRSSIEETGCNMLYLAIGFLEFYEHDNSEDKWFAPLILVPIQIERKQIDRRSNIYRYAISYTGEDITTNLSLSKKLSEDYNLILPDFDENTNPENYFKRIANMISSQKRWKVAREMIIGMFSFAKLLIYLDLDPHRWPKKASLIDHNNLRDILIGSENKNGDNILNIGVEYDIDKDSIANDVKLIVDADSSQHSALIDSVIKGENLVIEGPPGTGKSQTITNIIGSALHQGKSILFVSEKKAALDVVRRNLDKVVLGDFCLELHSHKTQKGRLHKDLKERIEKKYPSDRKIKNLLNDLESEKTKLISYSEISKKITGPEDDSIHNIFWKANRYFSDIEGKLANVSISNAQTINRDIYRESINILHDYSRIINEIPTSVIAYWNGLTLVNIIAGDEGEIDRLLENIIYITEEQINFINVIKNEIHIQLNLEVSDLKSLLNIDTNFIENYPEQFDKSIAILFIDSKNIDLANKLHECCKSYHEHMEKSDNILGLSSELLKNISKQINKSAEYLCNLGYKNETPLEVESSILSLKKLIKVLNDLPDKTKEITKIYQVEPFSIQDYIDLNNKIKTANNCPSDFSINYHDKNLTDDAYKVFNTAYGRYKYLINKHSEISKDFDTRRLPIYQDIDKAIDVLRDHQDKFYKYILHEYRNTKKYWLFASSSGWNLT